MGLTSGQASRIEQSPGGRTRGRRQPAWALDEEGAGARERAAPEQGEPAVGEDAGQQRHSEKDGRSEKRLDREHELRVRKKNPKALIPC